MAKTVGLVFSGDKKQGDTKNNRDTKNGGDKKRVT